MSTALSWLFWPTAIVSVLTTCYTGFLFAQGLARDLWQGPQSTIDLLAQAIAEGAAALLVATAVAPALAGPGVLRTLALTLVVSLLVHMALLLFETVLSPSPTRHHELAVSAIRRGPFSRLFWGGSIGVAVAAIAVAAAFGDLPAALAAAAVMALVGSFAWEYIWVEAGQSVPLS
jgi:formate-dependent nitrite reductase membrane component NrfD